RKKRFLNFLFFHFLRIVQLLGSIVATPRLDGVFLLLRQRHLKRVILPVHLLILRRKTQHIGNFRRTSRQFQPTLQIVGIVEERAARAISHIHQNELELGLLREPVARFESPRYRGVRVSL